MNFRYSDDRLLAFRSVYNIPAVLRLIVYYLVVHSIFTVNAKELGVNILISRVCTDARTHTHSVSRREMLLLLSQYDAVQNIENELFFHL